MIDIVTYTSNLPALRTWLNANKNNYKEISFDSDGVWLNVAKIPTVYNGNHSVSLLRVESTGFLSTAPLEILAVGATAWDDVLASPEKKQKLDLAYPRPVIDYTDEDGNPQQYQKPPIPGVIYG